MLTDTTGIIGDGNVGSATRATGASCHLGKGLTFDTTQAATVPYVAADKFGTGDFTLSVWVNSNDVNPEEVIVGSSPCSMSEGWLLSMVNSYPSFATFGTGSTAGYIQGPNSINDGVWHHLVAERAGTSTLLYVDGELVAQGTVDIAYNSDSGASAITVGNVSGCGGLGFSGTVDELDIFGGAASPAKVTSLMSQGSLFFETFSSLSGSVASNQCTTNHPITAFATVNGWAASGPNAIHGVQPAPGDWAASFYCVFRAS